MDTINLIETARKSFTVPELRKMLGIKKTESYWILKHREIKTVRINGQIRIIRSSFDAWYRNQTKYHIIGGPEPGESLKANSYTPKDISDMLGISEDVAYTLISRGCFETFRVDYSMRVTKESFERWYSSQEKYRLKDDRERDYPILAATYSLPDIRRMLGVHRNTVYEIVKKSENKAIFKFVNVAGQKRITIESFQRWYDSQSRYKLHEAAPTKQEIGRFDYSTEIVDNKNAVADSLLQSAFPPEKEFYRMEELMTLLSVSRKAAYRLIQSGEILAVKTGKAYLIPASEYKRYIERGKNDGVHHSEE